MKLVLDSAVAVLAAVVLAAVVLAAVLAAAVVDFACALDIWRVANSIPFAHYIVLHPHP